MNDFERLCQTYVMSRVETPLEIGWTTMKVARPKEAEKVSAGLLAVLRKMRKLEPPWGNVKDLGKSGHEILLDILIAQAEASESEAEG